MKPEILEKLEDIKVAFNDYMNYAEDFYSASEPSIDDYEKLVDYEQMVFKLISEVQEIVKNGK
jgi:hypothetical protein